MIQRSLERSYLQAFFFFNFRYSQRVALPARRWREKEDRGWTVDELNNGSIEAKINK